MPDTDHQALSNEVEKLKEEQRKLREEQERLRKQTAGDGAGGGNGSRQSSEEKKSTDGTGRNGQKGADNEKSDNAKDGEKGESGKEGKQEQKEEPKPPLKVRVQTYVRTHRKEVVIGVVVFVVLAVAAVLLLMYLRSYESTDDAQVDGHLNAISARVAGTVQRVYVDDNQNVTAGQLLVELDPRDFNNSLAAARAGYSSAEAQLRAQNPNVPIELTSSGSLISTSQSGVENAQAGVLAAEKEYQSRLAMLQQAQANDAKAQRDLVRYRELVQKEEVSHEQFDQFVAAAKSQSAAVTAAEASAEAAQKSVDQSRAQLLQAQTRLDEARKNGPRSVTVRQAELDARRAALLSAQAQADQAALNLSYTKIYAPVSGVVSNKSVEVGQQVAPGEQLLIVSQTEDIWITANFKETQLKKMRPGQPVDVSVDAYGGRKYHGCVESMPGTTGARTSLLPPENATGNYVKVVQRLPVRIRLNGGQNNDQMLRPGMSVEPKVWLK